MQHTQIVATHNLYIHEYVHTLTYDIHLYECVHALRNTYLHPHTHTHTHTGHWRTADAAHADSGDFAEPSGPLGYYRWCPLASVRVYVYMYIYTHMYIYKYVHMCVRVCVYMYIFVRVCCIFVCWLPKSTDGTLPLKPAGFRMYTCVYVYTFRYAYMCVRVCVCVCVNTYMYIYIYVYVYVCCLIQSTD